jgi:hypothetical protein
MSPAPLIVFPSWKSLGVGLAAWVLLVTSGSALAATISFTARIDDGTLLKSTTGANLNGQVRFGVFWDQNVTNSTFLNASSVGNLWSSTPAAQRFSTLQSNFLSLITNTVSVTNGSFSFTGTANNEYDTGVSDGQEGTILISMREQPIFAFVTDSFSSPTGVAILAATLVTVGDDNSIDAGATPWGLAFNAVTDETWGTTEATVTTVVGTTNGSPINSVQLASLPGGAPATPTLKLLTTGTPVYTNGNTVVTHTFAGNSNATYVFEYKSSLATAWQTNAISVNSSTNFSVAFTNSGVNSTNEWKNRMFFRVKNG